MRSRKTLVGASLFALAAGCQGPHDLDCASRGGIDTEIKGWCECPEGTVIVHYKCVPAEAGAAAIEDGSAPSANSVGPRPSGLDGGMLDAAGMLDARADGADSAAATTDASEANANLPPR